MPRIASRRLLVPLFGLFVNLAPIIRGKAVAPIEAGDANILTASATQLTANRTQETLP